MKLIIESKNINLVRQMMRQAGCVYEGVCGWFCASGSPTFIDYDHATGMWFSVIR